MHEGMMAMLIGLVAVVGSFALVVIIVWMSIRARNQRNQMLHQERMMAMEKGLPVPPDFFESTPRRRPYVRGLVWGAVGLGVMVFGWIQVQQDGDWDLVGIGVVLLLVGVALLIGDRITIKKGNGWDASSAPYSAPEIGRPVEGNRS